MIDIEYKKTDKLIPYVNNSRTHDDAQVSQIAASIKEFGFTNPLLIDSEGGIIAGHGRLMAAKKLGMDEVPTILLDGLSDAQKKAYVIADNKLALNAGWDMDLLAVEIEQLKELDFDIDLLGFDADELDELFPLEVDGLTNEDAVPEVPEVPVSKVGDIWFLGNHRLMCGDSTSIDAVELLMDGVKADMVFTDPPYGYSYESNHQSTHKMLKNDDVILDFISIADQFTAKQSTLYLCTSHQVVDKWKPLITGFTYKNMIVWKKNNWSMGDLAGSFAGQHEIILFASKGSPKIIGKRDSDVWSFDRIPPELHPTMKPVELIQFALSKWQSGKVLDLFLGSGSTLIACEKTNSRCYGMELDPKYCDVIIKRWQDYTGKKAIHAETGEEFKELIDG